MPAPPTDRSTAAGPVEPPAPDGVPAGRALELPGRGTTWVRDTGGPAGAPTLLLLHGWMATGGLNWFPSFAPLAAAGFRVVTIDHRGHGHGLRDGGRFRLADCADDADATLEQLGVDRAIAVGYSMGGPIAQLLWHRHRRRLDGLVLCATAARFRDTPAEHAFFAGLAGLAGAARVTPDVIRRNVLGRRVVGRFDQSDPVGRWAAAEVRGHDHRMLMEAGHAIGRYSSRRWIGEVDVPTTVVLTRRDRVVAPERQHRMAAAIPGSTVHHVEGDHVVCAMEPDRFVPVLVDACTEVADRAAG